jgi:trigger factor
MPGFRPGKVPVSLLRKQYGRSVMGEVVEQAVNQGSQQAISDHELRPALRPKIEVTSFDEGADLEFTMALELPEVPEVDLRKIALTRPVATLDDGARRQGVWQHRRTVAGASRCRRARPSQSGDRVIIDFHGTVDGEPFEGARPRFSAVLGAGDGPGFRIS